MLNGSSNIFNTLFPSFASDSVAVFDQNFNQLFKSARAIKATVKEESKVMEHPIETGAIVTDHRIVLPVEIELSLILNSLDYTNTYKSIRQYYLNGTLLVVQTRTGIYQNQLISSIPHEESPDQYNAISMAISLKEVQFVTAKFSKRTKKPSDSDTTGRGTQQPQTDIPQSGSAAYNFIVGGVQ